MSIRRLTTSTLAALGALLVAAATMTALTAGPAEAVASCSRAVAFKAVDGIVYGLVPIQGRSGLWVVCSRKDRA